MRLEMPHQQKRELIIGQLVSSAWGCEAKKMGSYTHFDVYFIKGQRVVALAEIRSRADRELNSFPTALIDLDKYMALLMAEISLRVPAFYIIAYPDGVYYTRISGLPASELQKTYKGRTDRLDIAPNDMSPVLEVPIKYFKRICSSEGVFEEKLIPPMGAKGGDNQ